jgi:hypothetical protein
MTIWGLLMMTVLIMKLWPETSTAQRLHRHLVDRPMDMAGRVKRRHIIFLIIGFAVMYSFAQIGAPHLGVVAAIDVSAYVDVMITVWTVAALTRTRGGWTALRTRFVRPAAGKARSRNRRTRPAVRQAPSNDDDRHRAVPLAA